MGKIISLSGTAHGGGSAGLTSTDLPGVDELKKIWIGSYFSFYEEQLEPFKSLIDVNNIGLETLQTNLDKAMASLLNNPSWKNWVSLSKFPITQEEILDAIAEQLAIRFVLSTMTDLFE